MKVLVSACLLGIPCRYDAKSRAHKGVIALNYDWVAVCPEVAGGLPTPRPAAEILHGRVLTQTGEDVSRNFLIGAEAALRLIATYDIKLAILKARSPSCGVGAIYDGTFQGKLTQGDGITAAALKQAGVTVITEEDINGNLDSPSSCGRTTGEPLADR